MRGSVRAMLCLAGVIGLCLLVGGAGAWAAAGRPTLAELGRGAEEIVVGSVVEAFPAWTADHSLIHTYVTMQVDRAVKGRAASRYVQFRVPGGAFEEIGLLVSNMPGFRHGEEAIVLLGRDDDGFLSVHGGRNGKIEINGGFAPGLGLTADEVADVLNGTRPERNPAGPGGGCPVTCVGSTPTMTWPQPAMGEAYLINPIPMTGCTSTQWINAIQASAQTWNGAGAQFTFTYGGTTTATAKGKQPDGRNVIYVGSASGALAVTTTWYIPATGQITECDMVVATASRRLKWSCDAGAVANKYDVQSVVVHELGHFLSLDDVYDDGCDALTMYGYGWPGDIAPRSLDQADICGIRALY